MRAAGLVVLLCVVLTSCSAAPKANLRPEDAAMFGPVSMRIHPIFTQVKDWTGDNRPDGIEALIEFQDQFGDPTKAAGNVIFELYSYRPYNPDPRGDRIVNPWVGSLTTLADQQARWNRTSRTYSFQLEYPYIRTDKNYVLSASFDTGKTRFFDRIIIEAQPREPEIVQPAPATLPTTQPATAPATRP